MARHSDPTNSEALVFATVDGTANGVQGWRKTFHRAARCAGIGLEFTPNNLRHTVASWAIAHGANVYAVQNMLGHAKPPITLGVDGELWEAGAERLAERLDAVLRADKPTPSDAAVVTLR